MSRKKDLYRKFTLFTEDICLVGQHILLLFMRLQWGYLFFLAGERKLVDHEIATYYFESMGAAWPGLFVCLYGLLGLVGGIFLFFGLFTRLTAFLLTISSGALLFINYLPQHGIFNWIINPYALFAQSSFPFFFFSLLLLLFGPGKFSLDSFIQYKRNKNGKDSS